jgi:DNA polymerase V
MSFTQPNSPSKWALVDCNSFFASCETLFRPDLKDKPVVVLSSNDGCIVAANRKAKQLGIKMFGPYFEAQKILKTHGAAVFSSNFALYADMSRRVNSTLLEFSPHVEVYSIDECFINLSGLASSKELQTLAEEMKKRVELYTAIPVCVGVGPTKVLAKLANHLAKNNKEYKGVCIIDKADFYHYEKSLKQTAVEDIWGIGRKSAPKLRALGLHSAWDFCHYHNEKLIQKLLTKTGAMIQQELKGIECIAEDFCDQKKKQIMCSRSFEKNVTAKEGLQAILANFVMEASEKLRNQQSLVAGIMVYIRTSHFQSGIQYFNQGFVKLDEPTQDTRKILKAVYKVLDQIFKEGIDYKKAGVILCDIVDQASFQPTLFDVGNFERELVLMEVMDKINAKEGAGTIKIGNCNNQFKKSHKKISKVLLTRLIGVSFQKLVSREN